MTKQKRVKPADVVAAFRGVGRGESPSDVLGSYKGCAMDGSRPVQDADDL